MHTVAMVTDGAATDPAPDADVGSDPIASQGGAQPTAAVAAVAGNPPPRPSRPTPRADDVVAATAPTAAESAVAEAADDIGQLDLTVELNVMESSVASTMNGFKLAEANDDAPDDQLASPDIFTSLIDGCASGALDKPNSSEGAYPDAQKSRRRWTRGSKTAEPRIFHMEQDDTESVAGKSTTTDDFWRESMPVDTSGRFEHLSTPSSSSTAVAGPGKASTPNKIPPTEWLNANARMQ